jgi:two-component system chemotaxis response regulator CheB
MIRLLLVDDSPLVRAVLRDIFAAAPDMRVVGEAADGADGVRLAKNLAPNLIIMDILMPIMDGLSAIEEIMSSQPVPILVLSATVDEREVKQAFNAIRLGALDVMEKPNGEALGDASFAERLLEKVRLLSRIRVIHHPRRRAMETPAQPPRPLPSAKRTVLAIGASTGGPKAVMSILKELPATFPASILVVQHIAKGFTDGFAQWLDRECSLPVRLASEGVTCGQGEVLIAPDDRHMVLNGGSIHLLDTEPINCCRPAIDTLFSSIARQCGPETVAVLLTGMGKDGAIGMKEIHSNGGLTIAQNEESCAVFGMPKAAVSLGAVDEILPLIDIATYLHRAFTI